MDEESDCEALVELFKESTCTSSFRTIASQESDKEDGSDCEDLSESCDISSDQHIRTSLTSQIEGEKVELQFSIKSEDVTVQEIRSKKKVKASKMLKPQPNFFFAIQIKHIQVRKQAVIVQSHLTEKDGRLARAVIKPDSFHITLGVVHLKDQQEIDMAKEVLTRVMSHFNKDFVDNPLRLEFQGVATFRGQVVYAKLRDEASVTERLKPVIEKLLAEVGSKGIMVTDKREWKPHLTLMKLSKNPKLLRKVKRINPSLFAEFKEVEFGYEAVESIQLCSMNGPKDADGYYTKVAEHYFAEATVASVPQPSKIIQRRLNTLAEATSAIKRKIHSLVSAGEEKKAKVEKVMSEEVKAEEETPSRSLKYVAAAGAIALGALVAVKTLKRGT